MRDNGIIRTGAGPAFAPGIEDRLENQRDLVRAGRQSGRLDRRELHDINQQRAEFRHDLKALKEDDGRLSGSDRRQLHGQLGELRQTIGGYLRG